MTEVYEATRQDFAAARAAFDDSDFQQMNICSNRLMANVLFGDEKLYAVPGFFMKNLAIEFVRGGVDSTLARDLRPIAEAFIAKIDKAFQPEVDLHLIWDAYFEYTENTRKLHMTPGERKTYRDNKAFSSRAFSYLASELLAGEALFHEHGFGLKAFMTEADRIVRNHGVEKKDVVLLALIVALDRLNGYIRVACSSASEGQNMDCVKSLLAPFVDRIKSWHERPEDLPYADATGTLCDIILEWRKYFLRHLEPGRVAVSEQQQIELPADAKKRIGDTIAQALQKDLVGKRGKNKKQR